VKRHRVGQAKRHTVGPRYELRGFVKNRRGKLTRVKTLTIKGNDPHYMAVEYYRITHGSLPSDWVIQVFDVGAGRGKLAPVVSYNELLQRAGSS
jgi:hypothetical protein